jgi:hypothetical protein
MPTRRVISERGQSLLAARTRTGIVAHQTRPTEPLSDVWPTVPTTTKRQAVTRCQQPYEMRLLVGLLISEYEVTAWRVRLLAHIRRTVPQTVEGHLKDVVNSGGLLDRDLCNAASEPHHLGEVGVGTYDSSILSAVE